MKMFLYRTVLTVAALILILPLQLFVYNLLGLKEWCKSIAFFWKEQP
jgi:hypothetical protein